MVSPNSRSRQGRTESGSRRSAKSSGVSGKFAARMPNCSARYSDVGVLPQRDTPTRITCAFDRSRVAAPSSCVCVKLIASIRAKYSWLLAMPCERPAACELLALSSVSSGAMKIWNRSSVWALTCAWICRAIASSTTELNTIGRLPSRSAVSLICAIAAATFSGESTKGIVCRSNRKSSNCVSSELPSISAVMPVRSETKKTVRRVGMRGVRGSPARPDRGRCRPAAVAGRPGP